MRTALVEEFQFGLWKMVTAMPSTLLAGQQVALPMVTFTDV